MFIKKPILLSFVLLSFVFYSDFAKATPTEDATLFAKRIDDTSILVDTVSKYSDATNLIKKAIDTFNETVKNADVLSDLNINGNAIDTSSDELKNSYTKVQNALELTNSLKEKATELKSQFDSIDVSSTSYDEKVEALNTQWTDALSSAQKTISDNYNAYPQNMNIYAVEGLSENIAAATDAYGEFSNKFYSSSANFDTATKQKIDDATTTLSESVSEAGSILEKSNTSFESSFSQDDDEDDTTTEDSDESSSSSANSNDSESSSSEDTATNSDDSENSSSGETQSAAASTSTDEDDQRTPYCSRSAGIAGMGGASGTSSATSGDVTGNGEASGPTNPAACPDVVNIYEALRLKERGLNFTAFVNAMKGFNVVSPSNGKLGILDFTQPSNKKRFYLLNLKDLKNPILMAQEKVSHGMGAGTSGSGTVPKSAYGSSILMSNSAGSNLSSIGFVKSADNYKSSKSWPAKLDTVGSNGKRIQGLEPGYNSNVLNRGVVMHSSSGSWADFAPRSYGCMMFNPSVAKQVINDYVGRGTLIYTHNVAPSDYFENSAILNGNHNIPNDCK